ncbi:hypothetical protein EBU24_06800 [bacterium]|nr:hypothetical protein [bacterium]
MSSQPRVVQTNALPPNVIKPLPAGASNIYTAGIITQNQQNMLQNDLVGSKQSGGKQRYRGVNQRYRGGNPPVVQVPPAPSYAPNQAATNDINTQLAGLANSAKNNAVFDGTVGTGPGTTAALAAQQQAVYNGKGGFKSKSKSKKGGAWPVWGCLSGGKKSRKSRSSRRRKTRKQVKRHRR